jgi:ADP-heptose:LPS heptosyltransferase
VSLKGRRVLVVRDDRIGDLVLALPLIQALKDAGAFVGVWASAYAAPLLEEDPRVDALLTGDAPDLRKHRFDSALCLFARAGTAWALIRAGIPDRLGPSARPYSLFFSRTLPLRRGQGWEHESELNLAYARALGWEGETPEPRLHLGEKALKAAKQWLRRKGPQGRGPLVVLHPGSKGSAQDWAPDRYAALGAALKQQHNARLLLTGGPGDEMAVDACKRALPGSAVCLGELELPVFAALLGQADLMAAGSTGPLHLAAAQGVPVLGFYPPRRAMSPLRWAPRGSERAVLSPTGLGFRIPAKAGRNEVARISVDEAVAAAGFLLR